MLFSTFWLGVLGTWLSKALAFIVMIAIIAFVHELGHYAVAKLSGVKVYEFALGFGQKLWSRKWGDTEYALRWIPLGAFVRPAGMNPDEDQAEGEPELGDRSFAVKNFWVKQAILAAGAFGNMVFAAAVFAAVLYLSGIQSSNIEVKDTVAGMPADKAGIQAGDVVASMDGKAINDHQEGISYIYTRADQPLKVAVLRYEKQPPLILGGPDLGLAGELSISSAGVRLEVLSVEAGKAAEKAGLQAGSVITEVAGKSVTDFATAADVLAALRLGPTPLTWLRPRSLEFTVVPQRQPNGRGLIGITSLPHYFGARVPVGLGESLARGTRRTADGVVMIYQQALVLLWTSLGKMQVPKEVGGPLKIASEIARGVDMGWVYLLQLTAFLSLAIGVFNLLPIPALDGGRMFVLAVKAILEQTYRLIRPKADSHVVIGPRGEEMLHLAGFAFLLFLLVVVSWKDVREMTSDDGLRTSAPATATSTPPATAPAAVPAGK